MSDKTQIEWTDATWNPTRGCSRVSEGCRHCYAEGVARRFAGPGMPYEGLVSLDPKGKPKAQWNGNIRLALGSLLDPLKWKEPRRIFVNSMSDLFHEGVPDEWIDRVFAVMADAPQHTFQILTKRPVRMWDYINDPYTPTLMREHVRIRNAPPVPWPLPNVWLGVSCEDQATADERIPLLLQTRASVRFVSAEPLLGPLDLMRLDALLAIAKPGWQGEKRYPFPSIPTYERTKVLHLLDWVIVGGESGPGARYMHPDWARSLRDQCAESCTPFFFKQWGEWSPMHALNCNREDVRGREWINLDPDTSMCRIGKKAAGSLLDGQQIRQFPEVWV